MVRKDFVNFFQHLKKRYNFTRRKKQTLTDKSIAQDAPLHMILYHKRRFLIPFFCFCMATGFAQKTPSSSPAVQTQFPASDAFANSKVTYKVIDAANKSFGYDIFADGRLLIHQPSVPGLPGNKGFDTKQSAEKIAELVIKKIKKGEMPPTISIEEMKKLKAIK